MEKFFEEVYKEAHLAETKFNVLKEDELLRDKFNSFNDDYFNGTLSVDKIGWSHHSSTNRLGACVSDIDDNVWIEISPLLKDYVESDFFKDVLVHEMIHLIAPNHGKEFIQEMERINKEHGLHITITVDTGTELEKILKNFRAESDARRADKINNNKNKPELQEMYDELNAKYFEGKLPDNVIIKYLPSKTFKTYNLSQVRPDTNSDWVFELKVSRDDTKKNMLTGLIPLYVYGVLKVSKKQLSLETGKLQAELSAKTDNFTNI